MRNNIRLLDDIKLISKDMWETKILGTSNSAHKMEVFRMPRDTTPFGFQFAVNLETTLNIEVHPLISKAIKGHVCGLNIYGIKKDGSATLLATEVL